MTEKERVLKFEVSGHRVNFGGSSRGVSNVIYFKKVGKQEALQSRLNHRFSDLDLPEETIWIGNTKSVGTYSFNYRLPMASEYACVYRFLWLKSRLQLDGKVESALLSRMWFEVNTPKSVALSPAGTSAREFRLCSNKQNVVSSVILRFPMITWKTCLKLLISRSQTPPWRAAVGGLISYLKDFNQS